MAVDLEKMRKALDRAVAHDISALESEYSRPEEEFAEWAVGYGRALLDEVERLTTMLEAAEMKMYRAREALSEEM